MVNFEPNSLRIELRHSAVTKRLEKLIASDMEIQNFIVDELLEYLLDNTIWSPEDGWYQPEPDHIVLTIPIAVYPHRAVLPTPQVKEKA
ncbi:MAG: hypothetical protein EOM90_17150 [Alphaproteobacteria bacterium]|jgi:hypothetical protein|nr:hypothetical protein [Alphaproteobacteria bacterium]